MSLARDATRALGGEWHGTYGTVPTPNHSASDRGTTIKDSPDGTDIIVHSFNGSDWRDVKDEIRKRGVPLPAHADKTGGAGAAKPQRKAVFLYEDEDGAAPMRMVRLKPGKQGRKKDFIVERPDGRGGWVAGLKRVTPILYRRRQLLAAPPDQPVYLVEGEAKADALAAMGLVATCSPFGAKSWRDPYADDLAGRAVFILPDNDEVGRQHAAAVAVAVAARNGTARILELPNFPKGGDVLDWLAAGGTKEQLLELAETAVSVPSGPPEIFAPEPPSFLPLPIEWFGEIRPQREGLWLVKRFLPANGLALVYGHPGSGKSFFALDLGLHVSLGWDWQGRRTKRGTVVYVGAEGLTGLRNRVAAFSLNHDASGAAFALVPTAIDLLRPGADVDRLATAIRAAGARYGCEPVLIIIDTLSKTFGSGRENSEDMATYVANCGRLAEEFACCVMPIHHRPKDSDNSEPRGHGSLRGGVDTIILIEAGVPRRAALTKQRDGETGEAIYFDLAPVEIGLDEDGEPVTSCVVIARDVQPGAGGRALGAAVTELPAGPQLVLRQLDELAITKGVSPPFDIPDAEIDRELVGRVVQLRNWREASIAAAGTSRDIERDTAKRTFNRALKRLQDAGIVRVWSGWAWRNGPAGTCLDTHRDMSRDNPGASGTSRAPIYDREAPAVPAHVPVGAGSVPVRAVGAPAQ